MLLSISAGAALRMPGHTARLLALDLGMHSCTRALRPCQHNALGGRPEQQMQNHLHAPARACPPPPPFLSAGALAGLEVVRLIREPVAAALAYGLNMKEDQTVRVCVCVHLCMCVCVCMTCAWEVSGIVLLGLSP